MLLFYDISSFNICFNADVSSRGENCWLSIARRRASPHFQSGKSSKWEPTCLSSLWGDEPRLRFALVNLLKQNLLWSETSAQSTEQPAQTTDAWQNHNQETQAPSSGCWLVQPSTELPLQRSTTAVSETGAGDSHTHRISHSWKVSLNLHMILWTSCSACRARNNQRYHSSPLHCAHLQGAAQEIQINSVCPFKSTFMILAHEW